LNLKDNKTILDPDIHALHSLMKSLSAEPRGKMPEDWTQREVEQYRSVIEILLNRAQMHGVANLLRENQTKLMISMASRALASKIERAKELYASLYKRYTSLSEVRYLVNRIQIDAHDRHVVDLLNGLYLLKEAYHL